MTDYTPTTEEIRDDYCLLADVSRPRQMQFDRWLAEELRKAKAEGFDEGWDARVNAETITPTENPYRQEETE